MLNDYIIFLRNGTEIANEIPQTNNFDEGEYNCGGLALGTFNWYRPYNRALLPEVLNLRDQYEVAYENDEYLDYDELCDQLADLFIGHMREELGLREVEGPNAELRAGEWMVAFRASWDDFHYVRRLNNGVWIQKCGGSAISEWEEERVRGQWECCCDYAGRVRWLAVHSVFGSHFTDVRDFDDRFIDD